MTTRVRNKIRKVGPYYDWTCPHCGRVGRALTQKIAIGEMRDHLGKCKGEAR